MNAAVVFDQAVCALDDDALANILRAAPDETLAGLVRDNDEIRRLVLLELVAQIHEAGGGAPKAKAKRNGAAKKANGAHRARQTAKPAAAPTGNGESRADARERDAKLIEQAIAEDITRPSNIADATGLAIHRVNPLLAWLLEEGRVTKEGEARAVRYAIA